MLGQGACLRSFYNYAHITADTLVKNGLGELHTITINGCGTAGTLTIYDNNAESGNIIAIIDIPLTPTPFSLHYDLKFENGLYLGYDATLVADITVSYG